ncbi:pilus assembly protein [Pelagibius litoralis]|uniref:Pilus assembly protein n=1 Tax=Pelagibius litoralis TaxID=374515 RepID=A0A967KDH5_9PROT|nr:TadE/TadG family type IV pilus assembly protein [Pelagibius litoralis]NIA70230.1 pilus assembly protein [Pelagibius litoralis]
MLRSIRRLASDRGGNAIVDFAFLLPIMLMLFTGVVEITNLLRLDRKVVAAAQTTADLITQRREISAGEITDILRAAELILEPYSTVEHAVAIVAVRFDDDTGVPAIDWQQSKNGGTLPDALTLVQNMGTAGDGIIIVRVTYDYSPVFFDFVLGQTSLEETAVLRPRRSAFVEGPAP